MKNKCPVCGSTRNIKKYEAMKGYFLSHCLNCGMVWDPKPLADLAVVYSQEYFVNENPKGGYANYFEGMRLNKRTFFERVKRINKKLSKKGKMLDVGSALGDSLVEAKKLGWKEVFGVEVSEYAAGEAIKRGLKIKVGNLRSAKFPSNYFDVVTMQDVIEHVPNPLSELKEIKRVLKPGGLVFIVTPDVGGLWHKLLKRYWYHYKPGEHIMYFSQSTLKQALNQAKFNNIKTKRTYHIMSLQYIFNRLRYYNSFIFKHLSNLSKKSFLGKLSFKVYTGEIEAWGQK